MVDSVAATLVEIVDSGGTVVRPIGADAPEITARFSDPAGNVIGLAATRLAVTRLLETRSVAKVGVALEERNRFDFIGVRSSVAQDV